MSEECSNEWPENMADEGCPECHGTGMNPKVQRSHEGGSVYIINDPENVTQGGLYQEDMYCWCVWKKEQEQQG